MNYEQRIRLILGELIKMMEGYAEPKHLNTRKKQEDEARNIVRMLNQKFPSNATEDHIRGTMDRALLKLKETHKSRTWPTAADISKAVTTSMTTSFKGVEAGKPWKPDTLEINAARIKNGEPVSETYIRGTMAQKLLDLGMITEAHLQPYLEYLSHNKVLDKI